MARGPTSARARSVACLAVAGAGLIALVPPVGAQAPLVKLKLPVAYNLCQMWKADARTHREGVTEERARQKCTELHTRVMNPPTGDEQPLPTDRLTAVEAEMWCTISLQHAWYLGDDVMKTGDNLQVQARCEQAEALIDPTIVAPNGWRAQFLPKW